MSNQGNSPNKAPDASKVLLARIVLYVMAAFLLAGILVYGNSSGVSERFFSHLMSRDEGPLTFRLLIQPITAVVLAVIDGIQDAKTGRTPYLLAIFLHREERWGRLQEGLMATARVLLIGLVIDVVYQILAYKAFFPGEAVAVALVLAFLPYVLARGPAAHIAKLVLK